MALLEKKTRSFTEAYSDYYPLVYSMVFAKIQDADHTLDICQEVFIRLYENFDKVNDPRKWLYGTLRNVIYEHFRRNRQETVDIDTLFEDISMSFVNGFRDTRVMIEEAFESLDLFIDEKGRTLFDLVAVYNYSCREAGVQLGLTERQVRYKYNQIAGKLLEYFREKGINGMEELL